MPAYDLLAAILAAKEQGIRAILLQWRTFAAGSQWRCVYKNSNRRNDVRAIIAWFIRDLLDFAGLSCNLAAYNDVFIGPDAARLVRLSNASLLKKPE